MNSPEDIYLERSRRVTSLLVWLQAVVDCHEKRALKPENAGTLRPMAAELEIIEEELKPVLGYLTKVTLAEIDEDLDNEGQRHD